LSYVISEGAEDVRVDDSSVSLSIIISTAAPLRGEPGKTWLKSIEISEAEGQQTKELDIIPSSS
jgi:hypothetical protein